MEWRPDAAMRNAVTFNSQSYKKSPLPPKKNPSARISPPLPAFFNAFLSKPRENNHSFAHCLSHEGTVSRERRIISSIFFSCSSESIRRGLRSFSSAWRTKSSAKAPVRIGTALMGVAISVSDLNTKIHHYIEQTKYLVMRELRICIEEGNGRMGDI